MEGDTPAFLHLIPAGLRQLEDPSWGGWGGRFLLHGEIADGYDWANAWTGYSVPDLPEPERGFTSYRADAVDEGDYPYTASEIRMQLPEYFARRIIRSRPGAGCRR